MSFIIDFSALSCVLLLLCLYFPRWLIEELDILMNNEYLPWKKRKNKPERIFSSGAAVVWFDRKASWCRSMFEIHFFSFSSKQLLAHFPPLFLARQAWNHSRNDDIHPSDCWKNAIPSSLPELIFLTFPLRGEESRFDRKWVFQIQFQHGPTFCAVVWRILHSLINSATRPIHAWWRSSKQCNTE